MRLAILGDYDLNRPSHVATSECIRRTSKYLSKQIKIEWLPTRSLESNETLAGLRDFNGIWGAPGDHESQLGMINGIQFSRENNIPYLGTWSGFQHALVEFAKNVLQLEKSGSITEFFSLIITKMACSLISKRQEINIRSGSLVSQIYERETIVENYNCSYSLNETYRAEFEESDLQLVGTNNDGDVRIIEVPQCQFFVATLFQPQLTQSNSFPHPLVASFLKSLRGWYKRAG